MSFWKWVASYEGGVVVLIIAGLLQIVGVAVGVIGR